ncbi:tRNA (adenosine(37)-N6)-threonylcarbamoyltransferase complex transferase subunit TsaD [Candidatus Parcubacteria bacterium]|nr:tRNA (adenosine(37)-N6)-threonylcarbamoyltransferase complex transferase subunit TsaD [Candidatus Parcubacteria bacterium]
MIILAIETSCDDTCISILKIHPVKSPINRGISPKAKLFNRVEILSNFVSSQIEIHKKYGGVYPAMAKREHQKNLLPVLKKALKKAGIKNFIKPKIDLIAVTTGPGLEPCLWTGVNFAKSLARLWNLKIIPVNHIEAHILANLLLQIGEKSKIQNPKKIFPAICLVVSGGHTQLILMKDIGKYKILGETRDDAAGECFDKTARILGLSYPGGPAIAEQARQWKSKIHPVKSFASSKRKSEILFNRVKLPRPMMYSKDYDFSFSGLKTAVLYAVHPVKSFASSKRKSEILFNRVKKEKYIQAMCKEIQQAVIDILIKKTIKAAKDYKVRTIILGGGVSANEELQKQFKKKLSMTGSQFVFLAPTKKFCTDNAAMIGITAYFHKKETQNWKNIKVNANLRIN